MTINRELVFLLNLYTMANTWGNAAGNLVKKVHFARGHNGCMRILTLAEEAEWLAHYGPPVAAAGGYGLAYWISCLRAALADLGRRRLPPSEDNRMGSICQEQRELQRADE